MRKRVGGGGEGGWEVEIPSLSSPKKKERRKEKKQRKKKKKRPLEIPSLSSPTKEEKTWSDIPRAFLLAFEPQVSSRF